MNNALKPFLFLLLVLLQMGTTLYGQEDEEPREKERLTQEQIVGVNKLIETTRKANKKIAEENRISFQQSGLFKVIREKLGEVKTVMSKGLDTVKINLEYAEMQDWHDIAATGLADSVNHRLTLANLNISKVIYQEILIRSENRVEVLSSQREELEAALTVIDSLINQDIVYTSPTNETDETSFYANTFILLTETNKIQAESKESISKLNELIAILGVVIYDSDNKLNMINNLQDEVWSLDNLAQATRVQEYSNQTLSESYTFSVDKLGLAIKIFRGQ